MAKLPDSVQVWLCAGAAVNKDQEKGWSRPLPVLQATKAWCKIAGAWYRLHSAWCCWNSCRMGSAVASSDIQTVSFSIAISGIPVEYYNFERLCALQLLHFAQTEDAKRIPFIQLNSDMEISNKTALLALQVACVSEEQTLACHDISWRGYIAPSYVPMKSVAIIAFCCLQSSDSVSGVSCTSLRHHVLVQHGYGHAHTKAEEDGTGAIG